MIRATRKQPQVAHGDGLTRKVIMKYERVYAGVILMLVPRAHMTSPGGGVSNLIMAWAT
jgi:hypothetical protein